MDHLKLRYLIREAIENVVGVSAKFSIGDKVTTVDGDTATVTMAEHPFYTVELEETGTTKSFNFKDLAPFQEKEISKTSEGIMLQEGAIASPSLIFHQQHKKPLSECIFRIGSEAYVDFYAEARELFNEGVLKVNELDRDLIRNTDIGEYGIFEGKKVTLDIPFINEREDALGIYDDGRGNSAAIGWTPDGYLATVDGEYDFQIGPAKTVEELIKMLADEGFTNKIFEAKAKKKKKDPPIGKPKRGGSKAYYVYVRDPKTKRVKKVSFGSGGLRAKIRNSKAKAAFAARHRCKEKNDRTKPSYWSCRLPRYAKQLGLGSNSNTFW